ncbi:MAG: DNA-binding response regulator [Chloroflexi bacterium]|nr:MAG: DNA-binding response regulator [Chloroflexota bacterium]MBL1195143.1 DNA-binding response regulator [Chloroflexota bacterium]NOH12428.1 response regulator transcription factor [Chloroflexota bacterium]
MKPARVLLADDHILFREGLAGIIAEQPDMEVVGEANDGLEAIVKSQELEPDLILMDVQMPTCDGIEATLRIKNEMPGVTIVMLTVRDDDEKLFQALKYGAQGYLLKNIRSREMLQMLRGALEGEAALSPELAGRLLEEFRRLSKQTFADIEVDLETLTDREQEVLQLVVSKHSDKDIAENLRISLHTVKSHIRNILAKLQVNNRREAARMARQKGWW